jgi:beta-glucosidase
MANRTYRYFNGKALYPFGYGMSFTQFEYAWTSQPLQSYTTADAVRLAFKIKNSGERDGDAVAQVYVKYPDGKNYPLKELRYFERVFVKAGKSLEIKASIPVADFQKWNDEINGMAIPKGVYRIFAGNHSGDEAIVSQFEVK